MALNFNNNAQVRLAFQLTIYFALLFFTAFTALMMYPELLKFLPFGGADAIQNSSTSITSLITGGSAGSGTSDSPFMTDQDLLQRIRRTSLFLVGHLTGTILVMLPISWTYKSIKLEVGFKKNFARSLIVLPICATTTVLLIQDSLALAFGLAALVAAVRFRVALDDAMDGIFIFSAICVGLASGIGYLGVAMVMGVFFCYTSLVLWVLDYGRNPIDEAREQARAAKLRDRKNLASGGMTSPNQNEEARR